MLNAKCVELRRSKLLIALDDMFGFISPVRAACSDRIYFLRYILYQ
jgi:hypothetical protein